MSVVLLILGIVLLLASIAYYKYKKSTYVPIPEPGQYVPNKVKSVPEKKEVTKKPKKEKKKHDGPTMTVFYYSQTGTAEDFATRLADEGKLYGIHTRVVDVENFDTDEFNGSEHSIIIFCVATYGEGDPPENAIDFHEWLMDDSREEDLLEGAKFAVFGLGDSTYENFNKMGKVVDKRLAELGAERIIKRGEGDSDENIEQDFLTWKKKFWEEAVVLFDLGEKKEAKVERKCHMKTYNKDDKEIADIDVTKILRWRDVSSNKKDAHYDMKNTYLATIVVNRELHSPLSERSCRHIEIDLGGVLKYETGDHLGIFPLNNETLVHKLIARLKADPDQIIAIFSNDDPKTPIVGPATLKAILSSYYDILSQPKKPMLRALVDYTTDENEKIKLMTLSSDDPQDQELYNTYILKDMRTILEVLKDFPNLNPPIDHFLELLPRLQPRYFSISSSPNFAKGRVHATAAVVKFTTPTKRVHEGVCTTWLYKQTVENGQLPRVPVFIRKSSFYLPKSLKTPIIMIGPGTGLAPFRGFLQERAHRAKTENVPFDQVTNILFFGCRNKDKDFIYSEELEKYVSDGFLELYTAFSRDTDKKVYVQHRILEEEISKRFYNLLEEGAYLYICGDSKNMSKDVNNAIKKVISTVGQKSEKEAEQYVEALRSRGRFLSDVW